MENAKADVTKDYTVKLTDFDIANEFYSVSEATYKRETKKKV